MIDVKVPEFVSLKVDTMPLHAFQVNGDVPKVVYGHFDEDGIEAWRSMLGNHFGIDVEYIGVLNAPERPVTTTNL